MAGNRFLNLQFNDDNLDEGMGEHLIWLQYLAVSKY